MASFSAVLPREKLLKLDARTRMFDIVVIGDEPHVAYNRVGLTNFFAHRKVEELYMNPLTWVCSLHFSSDTSRSSDASTDPKSHPAIVRQHHRRRSELPHQHQSHPDQQGGEDDIMRQRRCRPLRRPHPRHRLRRSSSAPHTGPRCHRCLCLPHHRRSRTPH